MKKFLLATAAVLASSSAFAADYGVVHPFYTPAKGKVVSTTSFDYENTFTKDKDGDAKLLDFETTLTETVEYGITDDFQIGALISKEYEKDKTKGDWGTWNERSYYDAWGISAGYNIINDGKSFLNTHLEYQQILVEEKTPNDFGRVHGRYIELKIFGGYNFDGITAFGGITYDRQIDSSAKDVEKYKEYDLEAGVFKKINDQISARTSLTAEINKTKDDEERTYWWNVGAEYSIAKNMAVGMNASYMLDNDKDHGALDNHRAYKVGVDFKVEF